MPVIMVLVFVQFFFVLDLLTIVPIVSSKKFHNLLGDYFVNSVCFDKLEPPEYFFSVVHEKDDEGKGDVANNHD
jgi:hypothetical protein